MAVVLLSFKRSGTEILSGIPEFVEIDCNVAAMIYYTLDGTVPTVFSTQYLEPVVLPTGSGSVTLSAVAYFLDGYGHLVPSAVLSVQYHTDNAYLGNHVRHAWFEGITYIFPGGLDIPFWFDGITGATKVVLDVPVDQLNDNTLISDRDVEGNQIPDSPAEVILETPARDEPAPLYSTPTNSPTFDPSARVIIIDGTQPRNPDDVLLINGPFMTLRDSEKNFFGVDFISTEGTNLPSGSLAKAHYDRKKGIIVFYYFDSIAVRWIKSTQRLPAANQTITRNSIISNPVVFQWNNFGRMQAV